MLPNLYRVHLVIRPVLRLPHLRVQLRRALDEAGALAAVGRVLVAKHGELPLEEIELGLAFARQLPVRVQLVPLRARQLVLLLHLRLQQLRLTGLVLAVALAPRPRPLAGGDGRGRRGGGRCVLCRQ